MYIGEKGFDIVKLRGYFLPFPPDSSYISQVLDCCTFKILSDSLTICILSCGQDYGLLKNDLNRGLEALALGSSEKEKGLLFISRERHEEKLTYRPLKSRGRCHSFNKPINRLVKPTIHMQSSLKCNKTKNPKITCRFMIRENNIWWLLILKRSRFFKLLLTQCHGKTWEAGI